MFKNTVFKSNVNTVEWFKNAVIRAVKTFAQTFAGFITVGAAFNEVDWKYALSVAGVSAVYSIVTSIAGIPEVEAQNEFKGNTGK